MMNVLNKIFKIVIFLIPFILIGCSSISSLSTTAFTLSVTELAAIKKITTIPSVDSYNVNGTVSCTNTSSSYSNVAYAFKYSDSSYCYTVDVSEDTTKYYTTYDNSLTIEFESIKSSQFALNGADGICSSGETCQFNYGTQGDYELKGISFDDSTTIFTTSLILIDSVVTYYDYVGSSDYWFASTISDSGESQSIQYKINFNNSGDAYLNFIQGTFTFSDGYDANDLIMFSDGYVTYNQDDTYITELSPSIVLKWCLGSGEIAMKYIDSDSYDLISDCSN